MYKTNPKTDGSGIICCIPQVGECIMRCPDCFFQSGRSYLEPLAENLPNMPNVDDVLYNKLVVRVNDGNDSNNRQDEVIIATSHYPQRFYNTSIPTNLEKFKAPVVLTVNPSSKTDTNFHKLDQVPLNLMFVRFRTNAWNLSLADEVVRYYSGRNIPVVLTFMAYFTERVKEGFEEFYELRKRTINSYWCITSRAWKETLERYAGNKWVWSCGRIDNSDGETKCRFCGNCLREYFATIAKIEV